MFISNDRLITNFNAFTNVPPPQRGFCGRTPQKFHEKLGEICRNFVESLRFKMAICTRNVKKISHKQSFTRSSTVCYDTHKCHGCGKEACAACWGGGVLEGSMFGDKWMGKSPRAFMPPWEKSNILGQKRSAAKYCCRMASKSSSLLRPRRRCSCVCGPSAGDCFPVIETG